MIFVFFLLLVLISVLMLLQGLSLYTVVGNCSLKTELYSKLVRLLGQKLGASRQLLLLALSD